MVIKFSEVYKCLIITIVKEIKLVLKQYRKEQLFIGNIIRVKISNIAKFFNNYYLIALIMKIVDSTAVLETSFMN